MQSFGEVFFAVEKRVEKYRFEEKAEDAFHGQRLSDHSAGKVGELHSHRSASGPLPHDVQHHLRLGLHTIGRFIPRLT